MLETTRMRLRRFTAADGEVLADLHGDPAVMRYLGDGRPVPRAVVLRQTLAAILREYDRLPHGFGTFAAVEATGGSFLGWFSLLPASSVGLNGGIELGYRLRSAVWGQGYATEGARALVDHAFGTLGVARLVATTMTVNRASRRVLERAGLRLVRTFFEPWPDPIEGAEQGDVEYELTRETWQRQRGR